MSPCCSANLTWPLSPPATTHPISPLPACPPSLPPSLPPASPGMKCVELGAGVGLVGLALAAMGARVAITDVDKVLPLMLANLEANGFDPARG